MDPRTTVWQSLLGLATELQLCINFCSWLRHCSCRGAWSQRISSTWKMVLFCCRLHIQWNQVMDDHSGRITKGWSVPMDIRPYRKGHNKVEFWRQSWFSSTGLYRAFGEWLFVLGVYAVARWVVQAFKQDYALSLVCIVVLSLIGMLSLLNIVTSRFLTKLPCHSIWHTNRYYFKITIVIWFHILHCQVLVAILSGALWVPYLSSFPSTLLLTTIVAFLISLLITKLGPIR